jgi:hypothetical protein
MAIQRLFSKTKSFTNTIIIQHASELRDAFPQQLPDEAEEAELGEASEDWGDVASLRACILYLVAFGMKHGVAFFKMDKLNALRWLEFAAWLGHPRAAYEYATHVLNVEKDAVKARVWFEFAAQEHYAENESKKFFFSLQLTFICLTMIFAITTICFIVILLEIDDTPYRILLTVIVIGIYITVIYCCYFHHRFSAVDVDRWSKIKDCVDQDTEFVEVKLIRDVVNRHEDHRLVGSVLRDNCENHTSDDDGTGYRRPNEHTAAEGGPCSLCGCPPTSHQKLSNASEEKTRGAVSIANLTSLLEQRQYAKLALKLCDERVTPDVRDQFRDVLDKHTCEQSNSNYQSIILRQEVDPREAQVYGNSPLYQKAESNVYIDLRLMDRERMVGKVESKGIDLQMLHTLSAADVDDTLRREIREALSARRRSAPLYFRSETVIGARRPSRTTQLSPRSRSSGKSPRSRSLRKSPHASTSK